MLLRVVLAFFLSVWAGALFSQPVKFCYELHAQPPYINDEREVQVGKPGILVKRISAVSEELNIEPLFDRFSWLKCQQLVKQGLADALFVMINTPEREQQFAFPKESYFIRANYPLFVNPTGTNSKLLELSRAQVIRELQENGRYGVGAPLGYIVHGQLADLGLLSGFQYSPSKGLSMVAKGKLDAYVLERRIGMTLVQQLGIQQQVVPTKASLVEANWHVAFNKDFYRQHPALVERFWAEISNEQQTP
ncbi:hypothetical protein HMF8227_00148 [Saliniradius amylolyticus]|uniref:Uncharacterized protein n=1 Tax=Saliniradius amylolyticus TaxID=2183582 RepID=A0A2S2DZ51_9ALTE|nr:transporter substrate-binding domain-containing protein [Saliniradius amylolyticus]AWL10656.1 hypothetical protein HMF8227_00148 [Saliniradius amylolyticus]